MFNSRYLSCLIGLVLLLGYEGVYFDCLRFERFGVRLNVCFWVEWLLNGCCGGLFRLVGSWF